MTDNRKGARETLQRIADALGTDVAAFSGKRESTRTLDETLELLTAFERVVDRNDRRACLDFVNAIVARQRNV